MELKEKIEIDPDKAILEEALSSIEKIEVGKVVEGEVIDLKDGEIWIDLGGRATGVVYRNEVGEKSSILDLSCGDKILTYVLEEEDNQGILPLSLKKAGKERIWSDLKRNMEKETVVEVKITDANKGGLLTVVDDVQGFIPVSQLTAEYYPRVEGGDKEEILTRLTILVGKKLQVKVIDLDRASNKLILSQKAAKSLEQRKFLEDLEIGQILKGKVSGIVDFGVFVNVGHLEGLVHISEVSWERVDDLKKILKVGDEMDVMVTEIDGDKVSLSIKRLLPDPFKEVVKALKEGDIVKGKVIRVTPFGAFVQVEVPGKKYIIDGLVHISELSDEHVSNPKDFIKEKEIYDLKVISIEEENRKLSLSLKSVKGKEKKEEPKEKKTPKKKTKEKV